MKFPLLFSTLSLLAASPTALSACLNCTSPIGNSNWANGVLAGSNYYNPVNPTGTWGLGTSVNGEGPLELRADFSGGFYYIFNMCPKGHSGYCRVYLNQVVGVVAGETYNFAIEHQLANVRGATSNTFELYVETLPGRSRLFNEFIYAGNTGWTKWTTGNFVAPTTANLLFTFTWRNDPNDAIVNIRRVDMKPVACRVANPNTSCAPVPSSTSTTTTTTSSSTTSATTTSTISTTSTSATSTSSSASSSSASSTLATSTFWTSTTSSSSSEQPTSTPAYPPVQGYNWVDCYKEPASGQRLLRGAQIATDDMTLEKCATLCSSWPYFGTEYGRECFCGLALTDGGAPAPLSECYFPCSGNSEQVCGAGSRMNLYNHPAKAPANPEEINGGSSKRLGCVTETQGGRTLGLVAMASDEMTLEMCDIFCAGYPLWGVEYGRECYCGNELKQGTEVVGKEDCDMLCAGSGLQLCGGSDRVMVYSRQAPLPPPPTVT